MTYVFDTNFFVRARDLYPSVFPSFWRSLNGLINQGRVSSVLEVRRELENFGGPQTELLNWINDNGGIFTDPTIQEQNHVRKILSAQNGRFKQLVNKNKRFCADPYVIAKAYLERSSVVTTELLGVQNQIKIPNVCEYYGIPYMSPKVFMEEQRWEF